MTLHSQPINRAFRTLVLLLALGAMLGVTAAANSSAHFHLNSSSSRCDLCFTAHLTVFENPAAHPLHAPDLEARTIAPSLYFGYQAQSIHASFSRGPPSLS